MVILTFHGVGPVTRKIDEGERDCWIEQDFLKEVLDLVAKTEAVKITVDDGNASDLQYILPELEQRNLSGTFFLCSALIGKKTYLSIDGCKELLEANMTIGHHGKDHRPWRNLSTAELKEEIVNSRRELERLLSISITEAACPFGAYDRKSIRALKYSGIQKAYTSDMGGTEENSWLCPRNTIRRSMSIDDVKAILAERPPYSRSFKRTLKIKLKALR